MLTIHHRQTVLLDMITMLLKTACWTLRHAAVRWLMRCPTPVWADTSRVSLSAVEHRLRRIMLKLALRKAERISFIN